MSAAPNSGFDYKVDGGSLEVGDPAYIKRSADREFYEKLREGEYCYVLNSRQVGKSSLRVQTMHKLKQAGIACTYIDFLEVVAQDITLEQWYRGLIERLARGFKLRGDRQTWLRERADLSPVSRFQMFVEEFLLVQTTRNIVIFFDEIDSIRTLKFSTDEFFNSLRVFHEKRATEPGYQRLTFALLGAATPYDLVKDKSYNCFNIGCKIELNGFQFDECTALVKGFEYKVSNPHRVLKQILIWTGGQPFLTQKLCWVVSTHATFIRAGREKSEVKKLARQYIVENWELQDDPLHLRPIRDRILNPNLNTVKLLKYYRLILRQGEVRVSERADKELKALEEQLQLSGLIVKRNGKLNVCNRIYKEVFNRRWVQERLNPQLLRLPIWQIIGASIAVSILVMGMRLLGLLQPWELAAFDKQMQLRPAELPDKRILVVTVSNEDVRQLQIENLLPDAMMLQLLQKLEQFNPAAIGIDIYRNRPIGQGREALIRYLQQNQHIIPICSYPNPAKNKTGIQPPAGIIEEQIGFVDVPKDYQEVVRRQLLVAEPPDRTQCPAENALSYQLAYRYLSTKRHSLTHLKDYEYWKWGAVGFEILKAHKGFYQNFKQLLGYQILLNYRRTQGLERISPQVTLTEVLQERVNKNLIKDKIILIGSTESEKKDEFSTPYQREIRGVFLHAHMVSQLISFVENKRSILWFLPPWVDFLLISILAVIGGILPTLNIKIRFLALNKGLFITSVLGIAFVLFLKSGLLLPLVPFVLAFSLSIASVYAISLYNNQ